MWSGLRAMVTKCQFYGQGTSLRITGRAYVDRERTTVKNGMTEAGDRYPQVWINMWSLC